MRAIASGSSSDETRPGVIAPALEDSWGLPFVTATEVFSADNVFDKDSSAGPMFAFGNIDSKLSPLTWGGEVVGGGVVDAEEGELFVGEEGITAGGAIVAGVDVSGAATSVGGSVTGSASESEGGSARKR